MFALPPKPTFMSASATSAMGQKRTKMRHASVYHPVR
jgi:hypothetical protein